MGQINKWMNEMEHSILSNAVNIQQGIGKKKKKRIGWESGVKWISDQFCRGWRMLFWILALVFFLLTPVRSAPPHTLWFLSLTSILTSCSVRKVASADSTEVLTQMKNSSSGSWLFENDTSRSVLVLASSSSPRHGLCPAAVTLPPQFSLTASV